MGRQAATGVFKKVPVLVGGLLYLLSCMICAGEMINGVDFKYIYSGALTPDHSVPEWDKRGAGDAVAANDGILTLNNAAGRDFYFRLPASDAWQGWNEQGFTIEFAVQVVKQTAPRSATTLFFSNGSYGFAINIASDQVFIGSNPDTTFSHKYDTTKELTVYRVVVDRSGKGHLYLNNNPVAVLTGFPGQKVAANHLYFGSPSPHTAGTSRWQYIAFSREGAYAPQ